MVISTRCQVKWEYKSVLISKTTRNAKYDYSRSSKYWHIYQGATALKRKVSTEPSLVAGSSKLLTRSGDRLSHKPFLLVRHL